MTDSQADPRGTAGPPCREIRQMLGVYVVGAIDPAERSVVDAHLETCPDCREELSSLAGLPVLLGRVPLADAERLAEGGYGVPDMDEPSADLLNSLLGRVAARRRHRRWRSVLTLAAAVAIAAGGAAGVVSALQPAAPRSAAEAVQASGAGITAQISYSPTPWHGTAMRIGVMGIQPGTRCQFWVIGPGGHRSVAGAWTISPGYGEQWYWVSSNVPASKVNGFQITAAGRTLLSIPAT
jgi:hypothetical protein